MGHYTWRCVSPALISTFTLHPAPGFPLLQLSKKKRERSRSDHRQTDRQSGRNTCGEPDRQTERRGWQIPGQMDRLEPFRGLVRRHQTESRRSRQSPAFTGPTLTAFKIPPMHQLHVVEIMQVEQIAVQRQRLALMAEFQISARSVRTINAAKSAAKVSAAEIFMDTVYLSVAT